jgi:BirA family biotin operon repressor/biotin-[acetyl-CoA-carboxylase] ligase
VNLDSTGRPSLDRTALASVPGFSVEVVETAASTNRLVADRARSGADEGLVVVTEHQTAGRGRLDRVWVTPPRAALTFSVLLRPSVPETAWPWLPLLTGAAVVDGVEAAGGPRCTLKWPNDVLHDGAKLAGLLAERVDTPPGPAAVVGVGLNVSTTRAELPVATATSLALVSAPVPDRTALLVSILAALDARYRAWLASGGDARGGLREEYERRCETLGRYVRVHLPVGGPLEGTARRVSYDGGLVLDTARGAVTVTAGDVVHVRRVP